MTTDRLITILRGAVRAGATTDHVKAIVDHFLGVDYVSKCVVYHAIYCGEGSK